MIRADRIPRWGKAMNDMGTVTEWWATTDPLITGQKEDHLLPDHGWPQVTAITSSGDYGSVTLMTRARRTNSNILFNATAFSLCYYYSCWLILMGSLWMSIQEKHFFYGSSGCTVTTLTNEISAPVRFRVRWVEYHISLCLFSTQFFLDFSSL